MSTNGGQDKKSYHQKSTGNWKQRSDGPSTNSRPGWTQNNQGHKKQYKSDYNKRQNTQWRQGQQNALNKNATQQKNSRDYCLPLPTEERNYGLCTYHRRFGGRAYRCIGYCKWTSFNIRPHGCDPQRCKWTEFLSQKN